MKTKPRCSRTKRDHSCQWPFPVCIRTALTVPCSGCQAWLCVEHMPIHDCKKISSWQTSAPALNALEREGVRIPVDKNGEPKIHMDMPLTGIDETIEEAPKGKPKFSKKVLKEWR